MTKMSSMPCWVKLIQKCLSETNAPITFGLWYVSLVIRAFQSCLNDDELDINKFILVISDSVSGESLKSTFFKALSGTL